MSEETKNEPAETPVVAGNDETPVQAAATEAPATEAAAPAAEAPAKKAAVKKAPKAKKGAAGSTPAAAPAPISISLDDTIEPIKIVKAKGSKGVIQGVAHVQASFNNTIVSITAVSYTHLTLPTNREV